MRERSFQVKGRDIHLREITDLVAFRASKTSTKDVSAFSINHKSSDTEALRLKSDLFRALVPDVSLAEIRAFEDNGWLFLPREEAKQLSWKLPQAKVFVRPSGRLALSLNRLTIKLPDAPGEAEANEILKPFGVRIIEKIKFSPGLFRVEMTELGEDDAVDVANKLVGSGVSEFAEPELVEAIRRR